MVYKMADYSEEKFKNIYRMHRLYETGLIVQLLTFENCTVEYNVAVEYNVWRFNRFAEIHVTFHS